MSTTTVNISFQDTLLHEIDRSAKRESRSRSDFLREAARTYIQRNKRWKNIFTLGRNISETNNLTPDDISQEINAYRKNKA